MAFGSESEDSGHRSEAQGQEPGVLDNSSVPKIPKASCSTKRYVCNKPGCNSSFSRPWRLEAHLSVHCGDAPFKCDFPDCTKAYTSQNHLTRHKKTVHNVGSYNSKLYKCPHENCQAVLKTNQNLKKHYKRAHVVKRVCPECGVNFTKNIQLKYHMQFHTGEFLYQCEPCELKFSRKTEYNRHMRSHTIHLCPYRGCIWAFTTWSAVRKHLTTHKPNFVCFYCRKPFSHKGNFRFHVLSHLPDPPKRMNILKGYTCHHCGHTIRGKQSLRRHMKVVHVDPIVKESKKLRKMRKPRKDKGIPQKSFAAELSNVICPLPISKILVQSYEPVLDTIEDVIEAVDGDLLTTCEGGLGHGVSEGNRPS